MRISVVVAVALLAGCGARWQHPDMTVVTTPEFAGKIEPYGGRDLRRNTSEGLGMVYATTEGVTCDEAVAKGFRSLLEQTKALGGERVVHVQAKKAYNWSGELLCRGRAIRLRGIAMPAKQQN